MSLRGDMPSTRVNHCVRHGGHNGTTPPLPPIWTISHHHHLPPGGSPLTPLDRPRDRPEEIYKVENPAFYDAESLAALHHSFQKPLHVTQQSPHMQGKSLHQLNHFVYPVPPASSSLHQPAQWKGQQLTSPASHHHQSSGRGCKRRFLRWWKRRVRHCCLCPPLLLAGLLLGALLLLAVAIALYLTVGGGLQSYSDDVEDPGCWAVTGEFRVTNRVFLPDLVDHNSSSYAALATEVVRSLDELFFQSVLVKDYNGSDILNFRYGSVVVSCRVFLNRPLVDAAEQVGLAFVRVLEEGHGTLPAGNLQVDIKSIKFAGLPGVQPPPKSLTEFAIPDASWSQWSEWTSCTPVHGTCDPRSVQSRSRDCRTEHGTGEALPNTYSCRSKGGKKIQVRDCICPEEESKKLVVTTPQPESQHSISITTIGPPAAPPVQYVGSTDRRPFDPEPTFPSLGVTSTLATRAEFTTFTSQIMAGQQLPLETSTENVVPDNSDGSPCSQCTAEEVCLLEGLTSIPHCLLPKDADDPRGCGGWCSGSHDLCRKIADSLYQCVDASECMHDEWKCGDGLCIPDMRRCDGHFNCFDTTDELNCDCQSDQFHCGNNTSCLPIELKCNGIVDCWDGSDENNCSHSCSEDQFNCNNGQCIDKEFFCDHYADCEDKSDEPEGCETPCLKDQFQCKNQRCISRTNVCDGIDSCGDNSDEADCFHNSRRNSTDTSADKTSSLWKQT